MYFDSEIIKVVVHSVGMSPSEMIKCFTQKYKLKLFSSFHFPYLLKIYSFVINFNDNNH